MSNSIRAGFSAISNALEPINIFRGTVKQGPTGAKALTFFGVTVTQDNSCVNASIRKLYNSIMNAPEHAWNAGQNGVKSFFGYCPSAHSSLSSLLESITVTMKSSNEATDNSYKNNLNSIDLRSLVDRRPPRSVSSSDICYKIGRGEYTIKNKISISRNKLVQLSNTLKELGDERNTSNDHFSTESDDKWWIQVGIGKLLDPNRNNKNRSNNNTPPTPPDYYDFH